MNHTEHEQLGRERWELLTHIDQLTEKPLIALGFVWLVLLVIDLTNQLSPLLQHLQTLIWVLFIVDFAIEFVIAPDKRRYLRQNSLTALSLILPAIRVLRILRVARAARTLHLLRTLTSLNRGLRATTATLGRRGIGYLIAFTVIVIFAGGAAMTFFESPSALSEAGLDATDALDSYGEAVWWTAMIMTTLGSSYWPQTVEGRILCWLLSVYALGVFGYITASIAGHFIGRERQQSEINALHAQLDRLIQRLDALDQDADPNGVR
ncbi:MAG: ion transporter [Anaerolineae bacterium]|jgi:voltage-gated potassium channel|nr:ion transporter [Anaerolineae bacterium]